MTDWLLALLRRKPRKVAAVALANKMARMVWAMMTSGESTGARSPRGGGMPAARRLFRDVTMEWNHASPIHR